VAPTTTTTPSDDAGAGETYEGGELPDIYSTFLDVVVDTGPIRQ
jgi:hypothetical protein